MRETVSVNVGGRLVEAKFCATVDSVLPGVYRGRPVIGAVMDNMPVSLDAPLTWDVDIEPVTIESPVGAEIYRSSCAFLLAKCAAHIYPKRRFRVRNSIGQALFLTLDVPDEELPSAALALSAELDALVERNVPVTVEPCSYRDAADLFADEGRTDETGIIRHRNSPAVLLTRCEDFAALHQSPLVNFTGMIGLYSLTAVDGGLLLQVPSDISPDALTPTPPSVSYLREFAERAAWCEAVGVRTLGDLNETILNGGFDDFVRAAESLHRKKLSSIADAVVSRLPAVRLVLVAGPSSAGKTTTAHRLANQLRACGRRVLIVSTDDYFVGDARNPRDENGELDYECIGAVDQDLLAENLNALFAGRSVRLRKFDFKKHVGYDAEEETSLPPGGIVVLEGIHALNPDLTSLIDDSLKFRVYLNAYTQVVVDSCNRVSTRDSRLLRRMIRDHRTRGMSPVETISMWPKVAAGERKWIFPYQRLADATFNSALDYELAVLRPYAEALLAQVKPWDREFAVAHRMQEMLSNVAVAPSTAVPGDSILRETIGGSQLAY